MNLEEYGIEPLITISHYETPLYLAEQYNGWVSRDLIDFLRTILPGYSLNATATA